MKNVIFFLFTIIVLLSSQLSGLSQTGKLQTRIITDTSILLTYSDRTTIELDRRKRVIQEITYDEQGKRYSEIAYNSYHTEVGVYKAYDSLGKPYFMADNSLGKAYTITANGKITVLNKPKIVLDDESVLKKYYGKDFVEKHVLYLPNDYFKYGYLDTFSQELVIPKDKYINYTKGFKLLLSNGKLINQFCVSCIYDTVTNKEQLIICNGSPDYSKYVFCDSIDYYYNKAKQIGLSKSKDYVALNFKTVACKENENIRCSGLLELNLIEILKFDTAKAKQQVVYNVYSFNPWTRELLGKVKIESSVEDFLFRVIDFEDEIYIHRFKDPLIPMQKYLSDIIKLYRIDKYKYIIE